MIVKFNCGVDAWSDKNLYTNNKLTCYLKMDIPSINIPSINIPRLKVFSGFSFPPKFSNTTWFIIVFVLGMLLLSCMGNRCESVERFDPMLAEYFEDPINRYEHVHFDGSRVSCDGKRDCVNHYDSADPLDTSPSHLSGIIERFDDNGRDFPNKPWYSCKMKSNCLPGENDTGEYCVKEGCPNGMIKGAGTGSEFCYPKCIGGYEGDGGSRCYKVCPEGYLTQGDNCIRPKHEYKKDVIPCKGCIPPGILVQQPPIIIEEGAGPVWMDGSWSSRPIVRSEVKGPVTHSHSTFGDKRKITHSHESTTMIEAFHSSPEPIQAYQSSNVVDSCQTNSVAVIEGMASGEGKPKNAVWRVEDRIHLDELACPLGYTLSGDKCYENCPPNYRDTGDGCVLGRYAVDRPSYDRGSGIPFAVKRSKYLNIDPVQQCV